MTLEQITAKAKAMGLATAVLDLIQGAYDAGRDDRARDIAVDLRNDGQELAVELLAENYGVHLDA